MIAKKREEEEEEEEEKDVKKCPQRLSSPRRSVFTPPSTHRLSTLVSLLQECADELHIGPHGLLSAFVSVEAQLLLLRPRAVNILQGMTELEGWKVLWGLFFRETTAMYTAVTSMMRLKKRKDYNLPDGHGRLLIMSAALLRQFISPQVKYPLIDTVSAAKNRRCLIRVLQQLITPGDLEGLFPFSLKCEEWKGTSTDIIGKITLIALRDIQPYSYSVSATITRQVLEGCIHYTMCTEVEGDVLMKLCRLLLCFLYNSPIPKGRVNTQSVLHRARALLMDPFSYIIPSLGRSIWSSRSLPFGTFLLPTTSSRLTAHEGTRTPFFILEKCEGEEDGPLMVLLLHIDDKGGLLDFAHSKVDNNNDEESEEWDRESEEGVRKVQRMWTRTEQEEAQLEAAHILYTWAWNHNIRVILTPSYVPPVIKTYGQRYNTKEGLKTNMDSDDKNNKKNNNNTNTNNIKSETNTIKKNPIFMVDEVDETLFNALLRRLQYWRHDRRDNINNNNNNNNNNIKKHGIFSSLDVAILRRGKLELPECPGDAILPVERIMHHSLNVIFPSSIPHFGVRERDNNNNNNSTTVVLIELCKSKPPYSSVSLQEREDLKGIGSIFLVASNSNLISMYKALLLKTTASLLMALDGSSYSGAVNSECGLGFIRAGGAFSIALARQMRRCAETLLKQKSNSDSDNVIKDAAVNISAISHSHTPVVVAVLQLLAEALLEVPRHLAAHLTAHHYPLKRRWWHLEANEMQIDPTQMIHSLTSVHKAPLHVYIREDPTYYRRMINPTLSSQVEDEDEDDKRRYFCCSDTESSCSESESEESFHQEEINESNCISFVEPVAVTTGVLRAAIAFIRLILICEDQASDDVSI
ncbi:uncharacterized protein TM35_000222180 [Trypanosoma theileri]|uniref:Uncharacterized protein n=1 Tax=Trypanosoma theileri TaxID=67003 RepID=A0A1X0NTA8_9TRYP|nr:uncharacterized protein TM35_000222180 [Trypanosoma theileri]ORC87419.1 hypothetical protein TM35_000222180 [Trypanosoma theileri]